MYNLEKLLAAIWQNPNTCTGLNFERQGNTWETKQRPDGSSDTHPYTILKQPADAHTIFVNCQGARFQSMDIWGLLKYLYSTNDFSDVLERACKAYGIEPEYEYKSEQHRQRAERRRAQAGVVQSIATYLLSQLTTDAGTAAREYLNSRGLKPSERIGAYSRDIRSALIKHLQKQYAGSLNNTEIESIVKHNLPAYDANDYAVVLPYYNGSSKVLGFCLRRTTTQTTWKDSDGNEHEKPKYLYSDAYDKGGTFAKGGYCLNLNRTEPVILVEGLLDAEAVRQAAIAGGKDYEPLQNILAVGGISLNDDADDDAKNQIATLQRFGVKRLIFVPDYEKETDGSLRTTGANKTIATLLPYIKQETTGDGFLSLHIADLSNADGCKDADDFVQRYGIYRLQEVINNAEAWYKWQLRKAVREHKGDTDALAAAAVATYKSIEAYACREMLRREFAEPKAEPYIEELKRVGITAPVLRYIDENGDASTWRSKINAAAGKLNEAVQRNATPGEVGKILNEAQKAQHLRIGDAFTAQANTTKEMLHTAVATKPAPQETCWKMYAHRNTDGTAYCVRNLSFSPAAVTIIAAPTNHGKTLFLLQTCLYLAKKNKRHYIYLSTENDAEQLYIRALSANIGGKWAQQKDGDGNPIKNPRNTLRKYIKDEGVDIFSKEGELQQFLADEIETYWRDVAPYVSLVRIGTDVEAICSNIAAQVEAWKDAGEEVGGVFIDYIQQLRAGGRAYNRPDEIKVICDSLNDLAKITALPIVAAAQTNRDATKVGGEKLDGVELANIGEGSGIENIAEDVYIVWQVDKINPESSEYHTGKENTFKLKPQQYRTRRCFLSDDDATTRRDGFLYVENLKARDYSTGCYCLLPFNGAAGSIPTQDNTAQYTPQRLKL